MEISARSMYIHYPIPVHMGNMVRQRLDCPDINPFRFMEIQRHIVSYDVVYTNVCLQVHTVDTEQLRDILR